MATSSFGAKVKLEGESDFKKALKDIQSNLRLVSSELKLTTAEFSSGEKSVKETKNSFNSMNSAVQEQRKKISELKVALAEMSAKYGEDSAQVKNFKTQLNNAEAQLVQMEDATDKNNKELKEMKENFDDAGSSGLKFGDILKANILSDVIVGGMKALGNSIKELGTALIDVGKQALTSYGDFEQLEGGVKKLFGDDMAQSVIDNANKAYKTAGMDANEYMDTVTGFSASLISSLNGDTAKAVGYADTAIRDMSDNANTFGTDISLIQNAYQGFAKQNYTMLDNLKLGYGGTKTEMQRLLDDASKISGVKYDISSFADITQAIHVMQEEMNIAETTYKEASGTIQGSLNAMGSSWKNLLTGLASGNANLDSLMSELVDSVLSVADNILPVVERLADNIIAMLPEVLNKIIEYLPRFLESGQNILNQLITGLTNNMPMIVNAVMQIISMLTTTIIQNLPQILKMGIELVVSLVQGISQQLPTLIPQMIDALILMVTTLLDNIDLIIDAGIQLIMGLADGLIKALPTLIDKIPEIIDKLITAIVENLPKLIEAGITLIVKLAEGLIKAIPQLVSKIPQILGSLINGIVSYYKKLGEIGKTLLAKVKDGIVSGISGMFDVGKNLVQGLWNGINNAKDWVLDKIKGFGKSILNGIKSIFGINSPSRVFRDEIGVNLAKGIGLGFESEMADVNDTIQNSLPTKFDVSSDISVNGRGIYGSASGNNNTLPVNSVENNTYNIYSPTSSPSEIARQIRKERQYIKLTNG